MDRKRLLIILAALTFVAALFITIVFDPVIAGSHSVIKAFHQSGSKVYVDVLLEDFHKEVQDEKYKSELESKIKEIKSIVEEKIEKNMVDDVEKENHQALLNKTRIVLDALSKEILVKEAEIEKSIPANLKNLYAEKVSKEIKELKALIEKTDAVLETGGKKAGRFIILFVLIVAAGAVAIFIERKAIASGEIKIV